MNTFMTNFTMTNFTMTNPHSIQFYVRNVAELQNKEVQIDSTYPLIYFESRLDAYNFIRQLTAERSRGMTTDGYLILNNPQLLPNNVRSIHQYSIAKIPDDMDSDDSDTIVMDGCFSIERNMDLLYSVIDQIDNNNSGGPGFRDFIQTHSRNYR
jgi:hypothetical protein